MLYIIICSPSLPELDAITTRIFRPQLRRSHDGSLQETTGKISLGPGTVVGEKDKKQGETAKIGKLNKLASLADFFSPLLRFFWPFYPSVERGSRQ